MRFLPSKNRTAELEKTERADGAVNRKQLIYGANGELLKNVANVHSILARDPRWAGHLVYNAMRDEVMITTPLAWHPDDAPPQPETGPWKEVDTVRTMAWFVREWRLDVPFALVEAGVETVARKIVLDPVRDYLKSLRWDAVVRLDSWLSKYLGVPENAYTRAVGRRWMISAVARAMRPGCKVDCVLVLEGRQGAGKSSALRALCPSDELFLDDELPLGNKDAAQNLAGKWIVELGEMTTITRHELTLIKAFITRQSDHYRPSYGHKARDFPRHCVFAGSTNAIQYLRDDENRRFWPVRCGGSIDVVGMARDRDLLWAEAVVRYSSNEPWYVDTPELAALCRAEQEQRVAPDPWEQWIGSLLDKELAKPCMAPLGSSCHCVRCDGVTTGDILLGMGLSKDRIGRA